MSFFVTELGRCFELAFSGTMSEHDSIESFGDKKRHPCSLLFAHREGLASGKGQEHSIFKELKCYNHTI
jgi:hypothetical protein